MNNSILWNRIEARLESSHLAWRERIESFGQVAAVEKRAAGCTWTDDEVFEAVLLAVLSSNTVWTKIEGIRSKLSKLFFNFSLEAYASLSDTEIGDKFVPWFKERRAGSVSLRSGLVNLIGAAQILLQYSKRYGAADSYFTTLMCRCDDDPKQVALQLGRQGEYKLPSLGVALAAEALKNLGFDMAKPDRHIMRAVGSFGLVHFNRWMIGSERRIGRKPPVSTSKEKLLEVMTVVEKMAVSAGKPVVFVDNAIWLLCAKDELYLTNSKLAEIARAVS